MARIFAERSYGAPRDSYPSPKLRLDRYPETPRSLGLNRHVQEQIGWDKKWGWNRHNLKPLVRFLQRRVGQRWDRVYREICAEWDARDPKHRFLRLRLCELVVFVSYGRRGELMGKGKLLSPRFYRRWRRQPEGNHDYSPLLDLPGCYYVDPDDGLLKDHVRFWRDHRQAVEQWLKDHKGIWRSRKQEAVRS